MKTIHRFFLSVPILLISLFLTACGDSDSNSSSQTLSGTAATGAAIQGVVYAKGANGTELNFPTEVNGSFTLDAATLTPPIMLKVVPDDNSATYYSYAQSNNQTVNITPLTHLAIFLAANKADPDALYSAWNGSNVSTTELNMAQAKINANLSTQMTDNGIDHTSYNFLKSPFSANSTGIDKVLDDISVVVDGANGTYSFAVAAQDGFAFDEDISIAGINIGNSTTEPTELGANETPATIPEALAQQYNLTYFESTAGSGIADGTQRTFALGADGTLVIDGITTLTNPVLYRANPYEAIWTDTANNLKYAFSSIVPGDSFNEINVSNNIHYDQTGFTFYGQFKDEAVAENGAACSGTNGSLTLSGDDVVTERTGTEFCPGKTATVDSDTSLISFSDSATPSDTRKGGVISLQVMPSNNVFTTTKGFVQIQYTQNSVIHAKYANDVTFATYGVTFDQDAKTVTFTNVTLPAKNCGQCTGLGLLTLNGTLKYN